jgi:hypothetical protein
MKEDTNNPKRNEPADIEKNSDPNLRDDSGLQPGIQTVSDSDNDDANENVTKTSSGNFSETTRTEYNADPAFDDMDNDE